MTKRQSSQEGATSPREVSSPQNPSQVASQEGMMIQALAQVRVQVRVKALPHQVKVMKTRMMRREGKTSERLERWQRR